MFCVPDTSFYQYGPSNGIILIYDVEKLTAGHLMKANLRSMKKFFEFLEHGLPAKVQAVHVFNVPSFFNLVLKMISPLASKEFMQKVKVQRTIH